MKKIILKKCFLDRDGVINKNYGHIKMINKLKYSKRCLKKQLNI